MKHDDSVTLGLLLWGLAVFTVGLAYYFSREVEGLAGGLRWLTVVVVLLLGGGLVLSSILVWQAGEEYTHEMRIPALILVGIGMSAIGGSPLLFHPWDFEGLAGGMHAIGLAGFLLGGSIFVAVGLYCYRMRAPKTPLVLLAGLTGAGMFYLFDESKILLEAGPLIWTALVILFISGLALSIVYGWPKRDALAASDR